MINLFAEFREWLDPESIGDMVNWVDVSQITWVVTRKLGDDHDPCVLMSVQPGWGLKCNSMDDALIVAGKLSELAETARNTKTVVQAKIMHSTVDHQMDRVETMARL